MKNIFLIITFCFLAIGSSSAQIPVSSLLTIHDKHTAPGAILRIPLTISLLSQINNPTNELAVFQFGIEWDKNVLTFLMIKKFKEDHNDFDNSNYTHSPGQLLVGWQDYPNVWPISNLDTLFYLNFQVNPNAMIGTETTINFCTDCIKEFYQKEEDDITDVDLSYVDGTITIGSPMSVQLLKFSAKANLDQTVSLDWSTATETNNSHFDIQRSKDGQTWEKIGTVKGVGNSTTQQDYAFLDKNPHEGENMYRLKQVDFSGKHEYSSIETVDIQIGEDQILFQNPIKATLNIQYIANSDKTIQLKLYTAQGQLIEQLEQKVLQGEQYFNWSLGHLPHGIYFLENPEISNRTFKIIKD